MMQSSNAAWVMLFVATSLPSCSSDDGNTSGTGGGATANGGSGGKGGASATGGGVGKGGSATGGSSSGGSATGGTSGSSGIGGTTTGGSSGTDQGGAAGFPGGGMGGLPTITDCTGQTPSNGDTCSEENTVCQSGTQYCACFDQGSGLSWMCFDVGGGGMGNGGFGNFGGRG